ncbi:MAG: hypothetical protein KatS3mg119_1252 [Rhodothalassiaceae bacterium]|nr:MAG: hypothetical protein KatS3mg119_1252 [Rhodothalassiaceae bacterium]
MQQVDIAGTPGWIDFAPEELPHEKARRLHALWVERKGEGLLPLRSAFHVRDLRFCLTEIALVEVVDGPPHFIVRVFGSDAADLSGRELTGRPMDFKGPRERGFWMLRHRKPFFVEDQRVTWSDRFYRHYDVLALPLTRDGETVSHILYWFHFYVGALEMSEAADGTNGR